MMGASDHFLLPCEEAARNQCTSKVQYSTIIVQSQNPTESHHLQITSSTVSVLQISPASHTTCVRPTCCPRPSHVRDMFKFVADTARSVCCLCAQSCPTTHTTCGRLSLAGITAQIRKPRTQTWQPVRAAGF